MEGAICHEGAKVEVQPYYWRNDKFSTVLNFFFF